MLTHQIYVENYKHFLIVKIIFIAKNNCLIKNKNKMSILKA